MKNIVLVLLIFLASINSMCGNLKTPVVLPQKTEIFKYFIYPEAENFIRSDFYFENGNLISLKEGDRLPSMFFKTAQDCHAFLFHLNANGEYILIWPSTIEESFIKKEEIVSIEDKYYLSGKYSGIEYFQIFLFDRLDEELHEDLLYMIRFQKNGAYTCELPFHNVNYLERIENSGILWGLNTISYDYNISTDKCIKFVRNEEKKPFFINGRLYVGDEKVILTRKGSNFLYYYKNKEIKFKNIADSNSSIPLVIDG